MQNSKVPSTRCPKCPHLLSDLANHVPSPEEEKPIQFWTTSKEPKVHPSTVAGRRAESSKEEPIAKKGHELSSYIASVSGSMSEEGIRASNKVHINRPHPTHIDLGQNFKNTLSEAFLRKVSDLQAKSQFHCDGSLMMR